MRRPNPVRTTVPDSRNAATTSHTVAIAEARSRSLDGVGARRRSAPAEQQRHQPDEHHRPHRQRPREEADDRRGEHGGGPPAALASRPSGGPAASIAPRRRQRPAASAAERGRARGMARAKTPPAPSMRQAASAESGIVAHDVAVAPRRLRRSHRTDSEWQHQLLDKPVRRIDQRLRPRAACPCVAPAGRRAPPRTCARCRWPRRSSTARSGRPLPCLPGSGRAAPAPWRTSSTKSIRSLPIVESGGSSGNLASALAHSVEALLVQLRGAVRRSAFVERVFGVVRQLAGPRAPRASARGRSECASTRSSPRRG